MPSFYKLSVEKIVKQTSNAVSISFAVPAELKAHFVFVAGQYLTLKKEIDGKEVRRAYSICSSPSSGELKIAVKAIKDGVFSTYATTGLQKGEIVEVSPPEGRFILKPETGKNYIAFAAGSGITPILSMIKVVLESENTATFTLIYGNKTAKDTIFKTELDALALQYLQFKLHYIFSRENHNDQFFGRIDKGHTNYFIKNIYKAIHFDSVFLCGPEMMIQTVSATFKENGFAKQNIHFELFTSATESNSIAGVKQGQTQITVLLDDEQTTFMMAQSDAILSALLRHQLDPPYSCQGGVCGSCIAKVSEGKAVMHKNSVLTDQEIAEGLILTCNAHPTTPTITVDYDDV